MSTESLSLLKMACPSAGHFGNWTWSIVDATINLLMERRGFFRWWRDKPSGNKGRETFAYCI
jgi:hypothetical protein